MTDIKANKDAALVAEVGMPHGSHGHGESHEYPYVAHHFGSAEQQFDSGKLGVWLFLVTEILFFAGLFCAYTIYRGQNPEVFYWAHFYLDTKMGAINTIVLILSSFTAAWAVRNAQLGELKLLRINIVVTILCAFTFMCVKYFEYSHKIHDGLLPGRHFAPQHELWENEHFKEKHPASAAAMARIEERLAARKKEAGLRIDRSTPAPLALVPVVNEVQAQPAPKAEADAPKAETPKAEAPKPAVTPKADEKAAAPGAAPADPALAGATVTPPAPPGTAEGAAAKAPDVQPGATQEKILAPSAKGEVADVPDDVFLANEIRQLTKEEAEPLIKAGIIKSTAGGMPIQLARPAHASVFFSIYFFMTGLHGVHVLIGIGIWIWMLVRSYRRRFGAKYFGPIDFSALYWHLVDLIWIYLFPMLYLIH